MKWKGFYYFLSDYMFIYYFWFEATCVVSASANGLYFSEKPSSYPDKKSINPGKYRFFCEIRGIYQIY